MIGSERKTVGVKMKDRQLFLRPEGQAYPRCQAFLSTAPLKKNLPIYFDLFPSPQALSALAKKIFKN